MPWSLENRDGQWCVVKQGATDPVPGGCHASRADAIKHQRALYANESRVASMYEQLDAQPDPVATPLQTVAPAMAASALSPLAAELVGLLLKDEREKSLVASMADAQALAREEAAEDRRALVAALQQFGSPVVNVPVQPVPDVVVNVPAAEVSFTAPAPQIDVHVPAAAVTVNSPDVNVTVEAPPPVQKTVTFERDPFTHEVTRAEVTEK